MADDPISLPQPGLVSKRQDDIASVQPLYDLVKRRLPKPYHDVFKFTLKPGMLPISGSITNIHDAYMLSNQPSSNNDGSDSPIGHRTIILIEAASLSGLGAGLNHYLKHVCQVEMTWSGDRFDSLPAVPPMLPEGQVLSGSSFVPWRYYMNVVTYGYSYAFWDWTRWERELDWMMLNGINMALAMVGQEYVFRQFYLNLGLTDEEIDSFLAGPAFTPWQRMGNLQGSWGYSSSTEMHFKKRWYETQWTLQQKIIGRMREFNITAVLPSFNGFVPRAMTTKHPNAAYDRSSVWVGMPEQYTRVTYIPSTEPLFSTLSQQFIQLQTSMYNGYTSHYYLLDLYNELEPPCEDLACFTKVTSGVMGALKAADPQAIWVMQGWFLVNRGYWNEARTRAFFDGIKQYNDGRDAFVFDLYSDVSPLWKDTDGYYGIDWGWSMLNNFGGGQGLYGTLPALLTEPFVGYNHPAKSMRGMGITMEGIDNNEFLYQLILDLPWHRADQQATNPVSGSELLNAYIRRRYGPNQTTPAMLEAWQKLSQTVWDCRTGQMSQSKTYIDKTPSFQMELGGFMGTKMWYDKVIVTEAWELLIKATETETWVRRRGHGPIINSISGLFKAVLGATDDSDSSKSGENWKKKRPSFTERIKQSMRETLGAFSTQPSSTQVVVSNTDLLPSSSQLPPSANVADSSSNSEPSNHNDQQNQQSKDGNDDDQVQQDKLETAAKRVSEGDPLPTEEQLPLTVSSFRYDLVDVTREVLLGILMPALHRELIDAYIAKKADRVRLMGETLLNVIEDTDKLLNTHNHFMLGSWLASARARAADEGPDASTSLPPWSTSPTASKAQLAYEDYLEFNARNQITWWGPYGQAALADYGSKHWGGLVKTYYWPRWKIFIDHLQRAVGWRGHPFDLAAFRRESLAHETEWQKQTIAPMNTNMNTTNTNNKNNIRDFVSGLAKSTGLATIPLKEQGDTVQVAQDIWDRWGVLVKRVARGDRV
ncbi:hypothetical protein BGW41_002931 [Actinomortierella wolfii]|nr:hypothetical protein BGW41_002931 [Actinomortierella wolfii]